MSVSSHHSAASVCLCLSRLPSFPSTRQAAQSFTTEQSTHATLVTYAVARCHRGAPSRPNLAPLPLPLFMLPWKWRLCSSSPSPVSRAREAPWPRWTAAHLALSLVFLSACHLRRCSLLPAAASHGHTPRLRRRCSATARASAPPKPSSATASASAPNRRCRLLPHGSALPCNTRVAAPPPPSSLPFFPSCLRVLYFPRWILAPAFPPPMRCCRRRSFARARTPLVPCWSRSTPPRPCRARSGPSLPLRQGVSLLSTRGLASPPLLWPACLPGTPSRQAANRRVPGV
jgi:hypothetical protein